MCYTRQTAWPHTVLTRVEDITDVGVTFRKTLSFEPRVLKVSNKAARCLYALKTLKDQGLQGQALRCAYSRPDLENLDMTCWHFDDFCNFWLEKTQTSHQRISGIFHTTNGRIGLFELWWYIEIIAIRFRENWPQTWHFLTYWDFDELWLKKTQTSQ